MQKLALKVTGVVAYCRVGGGAGCGTRGGMHGSCEGFMALDDPPHFRYLDLIYLYAEGSLEDIGDKKSEARSKFAQAILLCSFSLNT